jgi:Raf kinase inhibitor-like YbhB/YbcL family protein
MRRLALALLAAAICGPAAAMSLTSVDLRPGAPIPAAFFYSRCGGRNLSPQLAWSGAPAGTKSLVLTMLDRDAKPNWWSHWIVVNLPANATRLDRGMRTLPPPAEAVQGNFGDKAYDGPCPPAGSGVHHYDFTIWAMGSSSVDISDDTPANAVAATLARTSLDHATLEVTAQR